MASARIDRKQSSKHAGGRPQHPIRKLFIPILHDTGLPDEIKNKLSNVVGYQCPYASCPDARISGHEVSSLITHIKNCDKFSKAHKGIYPSIPHTIHCNFCLYVCCVCISRYGEEIGRSKEN